MSISIPYWKQVLEKYRNDNSEYQQASESEHPILRPDMYIGSIKKETNKEWIFSGGKLINQEITYSPGLYKIFDEAIVNAFDHKIRMETTHKSLSKEHVTKIKINIIDNMVITIENDGMGIPHDKVEKIFTEFRTSSNFKDTGSRYTGGKNGVGIKATVLFSDAFSIKTCKDGYEYDQTYRDARQRIIPPKISKKSESDYTRVSFLPSYEYFDNSSLNDIMPLIIKRVLDMTIFFKELDVYYNDQKLNSKGLISYIELIDPTIYPIILRSEDDPNLPFYKCQLSIFVSPNSKPIRISFVNGVATDGTKEKHIKYIVDLIRNMIYDILPKQLKELSKRKLLDLISVVSVIFVPDVEFESQSKRELKTPLSKIKEILPKISKNDIEKIIKKGNLIKKLEEAIVIEADKKIKGTDGKKRQYVGKIPHYKPANKAGTAESYKCSLILTEGESASSSVGNARIALGVSGFDYLGIYGLNGKPINPKQNSLLTVNDNKPFLNLKKIMGLQNGKDYKDGISDLNYGKIIIMTDADTDGTHIQSLIINIIHQFWPELLKIDGFITRFRTPCVIVKNVLEFYTTEHFKKWEKENPNESKYAKYCKGLATYTEAQFKSFFKKQKENMITFKYDDKANYYVDLVFGNNTDKRKEWLDKYDPEKEIEYNKLEMTFSEYFEDHHKLYGIHSILRSVPSICDGLKPTQRKVIYTLFLKNHTINKINGIKVASLSGIVSNETNYHHGEQSMNGTIIKMAQDFVGTNNINLLMPIGGFGSKDSPDSAGSPRYIYTRMSDITHTIFHKEDFKLVKHIYEEGMKVEPVYYVTVVPNILINGTLGIGTGYSSDIPKFNVYDIISYIINYIKTGKKDRSLTIDPYYRGFYGSINKISDTKYELIGKYTFDNNTRILEILELPPSVWIQKFDSHICDLMEIGIISEKKNYAKEVDGKKLNRFILTLTPEYILGKIKVAREKRDEKYVLISIPGNNELINNNDIIEDFMLREVIHMSNMYLFDGNSKLKKYNTQYDIIDEFIDIREKYYVLRKKYLIKEMESELDLLRSKYTFIKNVILGNINVNDNKTEIIIEQIEKYKPDIQKYNDSYDFLLNMHIRHLTKEKYMELEDKYANKEKELEKLKQIKPNDMWYEDIKKFYQEYDKIPNK